MEKTTKTDQEPIASSAETEKSPATAAQLPMNGSSKMLFEVFEKSVDRLEPTDRESVLEHHGKLAKSFALLGEKISEILSSEEGRRLMQQELQNRERSKK